MKNKKTLYKILLVLIILGLIKGSYAQVKAQQNVVTYLDERFKEQNIPVKEIKITQGFPLHIEIIIQSMSEGTLGTPEDPINYHLVEREVILSRQEGFYIDSFTRIFLSENGEQIAIDNTNVKLLQYMFLDMSPSRISDLSAESIIKEKINLYGMSATKIQIDSSRGLQNLTLYLTTESLDAVNKVLPQFMLSLRQLINDANMNGAKFIICRLEIKDKQENMLLNYMLDLQIDSENWWMTDGLTMDWFPHPGPRPAPVSNEELITVTITPEIIISETETLIPTETITPTP